MKKQIGIYSNQETKTFVSPSLCGETNNCHKSPRHEGKKQKGFYEKIFTLDIANIY